MDDYELLEVPPATTDITDLTNLAIILEKDIPLSDRTKLIELFDMAVDIVHMNMTVETIETTMKYNNLITGINRSNIKTVK